MALVNGIDLLRSARRDGYALGGFDAFDLHSARAAVMAAELEGSPIFLMGCVRTVEQLGFGRVAAMLRFEAESARVPIAVHFDHGPQVTSLADVDAALEAGFTSIMVDGSRLPLEENIALTAEAVRRAHAMGAGVEAEIGKIGRVAGGRPDDVALRHSQGEDPRTWFTRIEDAVRLVKDTGVDYLTVSIGSVSGTSSHLDLPLLRDLSQSLDLPLVLHGGTGVPEQDLREAIPLGIAKINIAAGVRRACIGCLRSHLADGANTENPFDLFDAATQSMRQYIQAKIRQLRVH
jgi:fructose-bisphosphate aldolase class II